MLSAARAGVRSSRPTAAGGAPSRMVVAPLRRSPPRPGSRNISSLGRCAEAPATARTVVLPRKNAFHAQRRAAAAAGGKGGNVYRAAVGGGDRGGGDGEDSGSDSSDSDSSDDDDDSDSDSDPDEAEDHQALDGEERGAEGKDHDAHDAGLSGRGGDYRSIGREIYDGGDAEAGDALRGMYDFVDDLVETQHVPTIRDPFDAKGRFHRCPGKKQGKAALQGTCEIFNIKELHINNTPLLKRFVNDAAMVLGRNRTGLCAKCQRKVRRTIKAARQIGLIPTISNFEIRDTGPGGLHAWAGKDGNHDAMAKAKAVAEATLKKKENKRFGSLV